MPVFEPGAMSSACWRRQPGGARGARGTLRRWTSAQRRLPSRRRSSRSATIPPGNGPSAGERICPRDKAVAPCHTAWPSTYRTPAPHSRPRRPPPRWVGAAPTMTGCPATKGRERMERQLGRFNRPFLRVYTSAQTTPSARPQCLGVWRPVPLRRGDASSRSGHGSFSTQSGCGRTSSESRP